MRSIFTTLFQKCTATIFSLFILSLTIAHAQIGPGWQEYFPTKRIHLDDEAGLQTFTWTSYKSVCTPICADYSYDAATNSETFRILTTKSNRSEIRLQNEYSSGSRQFEGYVTFYAPLNDESLMQIFGSTSGATQLMLRGYAANGGSITGGGKTVATNVYGREVKVNVIHLQEDVGNKIQIYIDDVKMAEIADNEAVTNYQKYGNYGTMRTGEAVVKWRNVRVFRDGTAPDQTGVLITSPTPAAQFNAPADITVGASAFDANAPIVKVEFFNGANKIGEDLTAPFSVNWPNVPAGAYTLAAKSTNTLGGVLTSPAVNITVNPPLPPQSPYQGIVRTIPGKIEAEDYDEGGQGVAYNDLTAGNNYNVYRTNESVDVQPCGDAGGGYNVALVAAGEWVEYTVNVENEGIYQMDLRLAATATGRALHVEMDGVNISGRIAVPNTGNFQVYRTVSITTPVLTAGKKIMRVFFETPSHNLNYILFTERTQRINFDEIGDKTFGDAPLVLNASATSGLPVTFQVISGPATITDNVLTITGTGTVVVRASQSGDSFYFPATAEQTFLVNKAEQTISFGPIPPTNENGTVQLSATSSSGLPVTFSIVSGPGMLAGNLLSFTGEGNVTIRAAQDGNENYLPADAVSQTMLVYGDDEKKDSIRLIVYPNPTKGAFKVKLDNKKDKEYTIAVYDDSGNMVASSVVAKSFKMFEVDFTISGQNGYYYVHVSDGSQTFIRKIIKQ